ncbi:MAG: hypothetical protein JW715_06935 [Sedimentisphaerales bacterium]|nr:hypothetical protein [Sedimentisphaerales bacterium]
MGDGAHVGPTIHEVFNKPYKVRPESESIKPPGNYNDRHLPVEPNIPDKMDIWYVQHSRKSYGGVVSRAYAFEDSPDAEALVLGLNHGKEYGAVGIGRHGNFLQWGYSAPPSQMTDAGQKLFINCICYIKKFDGKLPLVQRKGSPREDALRLGAVVNRIKSEDFFPRNFGAELSDDYKNEPSKIVQYYVDNFELIYRQFSDIESGFRVDKELKKLEISSNRKIATLEKLIKLLNNPEKSRSAEIALKRYTDQSFKTPEQWRKWLENNRDRIFFSDFGGYKFLVVPEGYLENK